MRDMPSSRRQSVGVTAFNAENAATLSIAVRFLKGSGENIWCQIYHNGRPMQCIAFPLNEKDIADVNYECGYYFEKIAPL